MRHEGGQSYTVRWFWKGKCWEAPATKALAHKAAPKQEAQAAKGRTVQQTATDQQQKTTTGPAQTTKATVPERYQDKTPAEDQELAGLRREVGTLEGAKTVLGRNVGKREMFSDYLGRVVGLQPDTYPSIRALMERCQALVGTR